MKYYKKIVAFRIAYRKLNYVKTKMTLSDLKEWTNEWCASNDVPSDLYNEFFHLADSFADYEIYERIICRRLRNKNLRNRQ